MVLGLVLLIVPMVERPHVRSIYVPLIHVGKKRCECRYHKLHVIMGGWWWKERRPAPDSLFCPYDKIPREARALLERCLCRPSLYLSVPQCYLTAVSGVCAVYAEVADYVFRSARCKLEATFNIESVSDCCLHVRHDCSTKQSASALHSLEQSQFTLGPVFATESQLAYVVFVNIALMQNVC